MITVIWTGTVIGLSLLFLGYRFGYRKGLEKGETIGYNAAKKIYEAKKTQKRIYMKPSINSKDKENLVWMG